NAVKFTDQGSVKIIVQKHKPDDGSDVLYFDIEDTGPGMSQQQAENIFHAFSQADSSIAQQHGGTGLGLIISRKLAQLLGGEVSLLWTEQGKGSCFRLVLPIIPLPQTCYLTGRQKNRVEHVSKSPSTQSEQLPSQTRILFAEDVPDNQRLISFLLKKMGAIVDIADNGAIAYQMIQEAETAQEPYDLLLTDMQMPEMDGYTLAKILREENTTLSIIALTAYAMPEDRLKCINAGCDDFLSKPVNSKILANTIVKWLAHYAEIKT
ncbi:MAG: response regulator, partial [Gimesia sp.]